MDIDDFPIGTKVETPSGKIGKVVKHRGYESKRDDFMRVVICYDGSDGKDIVALQPALLKKVAG